MNLLVRAAKWYLNLRLGYVAPAGGRICCTKGDSVIYGDLLADNGGYVQVLIEGRTLVTLPTPAWEIVPCPVPQPR